MTKTKQINFRLSPSEIDKFKAIALSFGMDASQYFRARFLDATTENINLPSISLDDLQKRAKLAERIIKAREVDKKPDPNRAALLYYSNIISLRMDEIAEYVVSTSTSDSEKN